MIRTGHTLWAVAIVLPLVSLMVACSTPEIGSVEPGPNETVTPVTVTERDITAVLVVEGTVVPSPSAIIASPATGEITYKELVLTASDIDAGTILGNVGGKKFALPFDGRVTASAYPNGAQVVKGAPVATGNYVGFGIAAKIPVDQLYRLYSRPTTAMASVTGGPAGIECNLFATELSGEEAVGTTSVTCLLPKDAPVVAGLPAKLGINTATKEGVLAVPVTAVLGSVGEGRVTLVENGEQVVKTVGLGITDGSFIEIVSGLKAGDKILSHAPGLR